MDELIIKITIVSKPLAYWQTNDPIIPFGQAAHVVENAVSQVRIGDGVSKWSTLPDKNIDMSVAPHHGTHDKSGTDPVSLHLVQISDFATQHGSVASSDVTAGHIKVATDADIAAGTSTTKAVNPKQLKSATDGLNSSITTTNNNLTTLAAKVRNITTSSAGPSGGASGDLWMQYIP